MTIPKEVKFMFNFDQQVKNIDGWLTKAEGLLLYNLAKKTKPGSMIVEIGSWKGKSTICLGMGIRDHGVNNIYVYAVDPHTGNESHRRRFGRVDTFQMFQSNIELARLGNVVSPIRSTSEEASKSFAHGIELLFIDGAHDYQSVSQDFGLWFSKVKDGGFVAFHDTWHILDVALFTGLLLLTSSKIKNPKLVDTITYFKKVDRNNLFDRIFNFFFIFYRLLWGIKGGIKMFFINLGSRSRYKRDKSHELGTIK